MGGHDGWRGGRCWRNMCNGLRAKTTRSLEECWEMGMTEVEAVEGGKMERMYLKETKKF